MSRTRRILASVAAVAMSVAIVLLLVLLGAGTRGPVTQALGSLGSTVGHLEAALVQQFRGPGRAADLGWLGDLRTDPDALRRPDVLLLGAYDGGLPESLEGIQQLDEALGTPLPLIQVYTAWGDQPEQAFPRRIVEAIQALGSIPVVTWEPWLTTFENRLHPRLPLRDQRDSGGLAAVARGDYDFYIDPWMQAAAEVDAPVLVRLAHEMNDPYRYPWGPQNNENADFIAAWRHVVERARSVGADNILWVWSPHVAYEGYETYWPGDDMVDWVATGALNYGNVAYWSVWWSFRDIFGRHHDFLSGFGKPIMIAEFGSLAVGGDRAAWYDEAFRGLQVDYPAVKALLFFHVSADATVTRQAVDWSFLGDTAVVRTVREHIASTH